MRVWGQHACCKNSAARACFSRASSSWVPPEISLCQISVPLPFISGNPQHLLFGSTLSLSHLSLMSVHMHVFERGMGRRRPLKTAHFQKLILSAGLCRKLLPLGLRIIPRFNFVVSLPLGLPVRTAEMLCAEGPETCIQFCGSDRRKFNVIMSINKCLRKA